VHALLKRHLKRAGITETAPPADATAWAVFLDRISRAYTEADQDRYLLERSLSLSSDEMRGLHAQAAGDRDALKTVIESLAEGVCAMDREGTVLFVNAEAVRLLALEHAPCVGRRLADLVDIRSEQGTPIEQMAAELPPKGREARLIIREDRSRFIVSMLTRMGSQGYVLALRDHTRSKQIETEREELNRRLIETSRQAGMAEVATGVLHNVGNVLNSVNVSASLLVDKVRRSRISSVDSAASLLRRNEDRLAEFLTSDDAGRRLPAFLSKLASHLAQEHEEVARELDLLTRNVEHIKEIVNTQQAFAKCGGVCEAESIESLVEDSLRINDEALVRHKVALVREFLPTPTVHVDKHQVLQILINLISNAKYAVAGRENPTVTVRIGAPVAQPGVVRVQVADNGVGISPENLTRIFAHGFTTRKDGHGFGLHSAALAAKAMGASLHAESPGPGMGATFTLDLPMKQEACPA
jgi:nitrogen fixation/metabolism regulation signal transduction histidine kinase